MAKTAAKVTARAKRVRRIRKKIEGTAERPRMCVFRSNKHIYVQLVDDSKQATLASMSTLDKDFTCDSGKGKIEIANEVGKQLAKRALSVGITTIVFDRSGYIYHGRVKSLSDGVREGGLKF